MCCTGIGTSGLLFQNHVRRQSIKLKITQSAHQEIWVYHEGVGVVGVSLFVKP
jgi:hypothetical protein